MITGPSGRLTSRVRLDGYRAALDQAGIEPDPALIRYGDYSHEPAYRLSLELLRMPDRPTAVFAGNDLQAPAHQRRGAGDPAGRAGHPADRAGEHRPGVMIAPFGLLERRSVGRWG